MNTRLIFLAVLLVAGVALGVALYVTRTQPPVHSTFTSAFQIFGETIRVADRFAGRLMPVSDFDEAQLGQALKSYYIRADSPASAYINELLLAVSASAQKDFGYEAHVIPSPVPNAMALPGGIVFVTEGLLETLDNEAQLISVIAHEVGHIELSHCVDRVKYEITAKKLGMMPLGEIADMTVNLMLRDAFSKTQEHEADMYAWTWLRHSRYDPAGVGGAFASLQRFDDQHGGTGYRPGVLRDYFSSHPPLEVRSEEFANRAERWWRQNSDERRYGGASSLANLEPLGDGPGYADEWVTGQ